MLALKPQPTWADLQKLDATMSREQLFEQEALWTTLIELQEWPDLAISALLGLYVPPHQRTMLYQAHRGAGMNIVVASRGTAKSASICTVYPAYMGPIYPRRLAVTLSMVGFRGGQMLFNDMERLLDGGWDSQQQRHPFIRACIPNKPKPVSRKANYWEIIFDSHSKNTTFPTKDEENIRGIRGHDLYVDEANQLTKELIELVAIPFLNVMSDMRHGGAYAERNRVFLVSTIDYSWRPFQDYVHTAKVGLRRDFDARAALDRGDWETYDALSGKGLHDYTFTRFDYTDLLIRTELTTRDGKVMKVNYPDKVIPVTHDRAGIPFITMGEDGRIAKESGPISYVTTYAISKDSLERGLRDGSADEAGWKAEQRNITDTAVGDVYSNQIVDDATCYGSRCIIPFKKLPPSWQKQHAKTELDYVSTPMFECKDPCVLGVDYAPSSDFCAFVVIRMGPMAGPIRDFNETGEFDPMTGHGKTAWSNVIWCEQHLKMSYRQVADKIREFRDRYNLTYHHDARVENHWEACRAIGIDMRGGGNGIRDELLWLNEETLRPEQYRLYDPLDKDKKILLFAGRKEQEPLPMLDCIWPTDETNDRLVTYTVAQMQQGFLYLPKSLDESQRPDRSANLDIAYRAGEALEKQLRKLRQKPTKNYRNFYMDGDTKEVTNKKDLWAAFIYAAKQLRAHIIRQRTIENAPPPRGARVAVAGSKRGQHGRAIGAKP